MENQELQDIIQKQSELKNLSNGKLIEFLDKLSFEFERMKYEIISSSKKLDLIEETYNKILKEYESRNNV